MKKDKSPFVAIPASLGGIIIAIIVIMLIFSPASMIYINSITWSLVTLGIVALYFAHKAQK